MGGYVSCKSLFSFLKIFLEIQKINFVVFLHFGGFFSSSGIFDPESSFPCPFFEVKISIPFPLGKTPLLDYEGRKGVSWMKGHGEGKGRMDGGVFFI